jgi:hypothetical protein
MSPSGSRIIIYEENIQIKIVLYTFAVGMVAADRRGVKPTPTWFKPGQANPSPAKQIQIKLLGFAWFYSSESGLINGLRRFQIRIFFSTPSSFVSD